MNATNLVAEGAFNIVKLKRCSGKKFKNFFNLEQHPVEKENLVSYKGIQIDKLDFFQLTEQFWFLILRWIAFNRFPNGTNILDLAVQTSIQAVKPDPKSFRLKPNTNWIRLRKMKEFGWTIHGADCTHKNSQVRMSHFGW